MGGSLAGGAFEGGDSVVSESGDVRPHNAARITMKGRYISKISKLLRLAKET